MPVPIMDVLKYGCQWESVNGVVVNPFGAPFAMRKEMLGHFINDCEEWAKKQG